MNPRVLPAIFLGSILLEPNRWRRDRPATLRLAGWIDHVKAAGFDGLEVFEKHWSDATAAEQAALRDSRLRILLNSYAPLTDNLAGMEARARATAAARALRAEGIKFNFGADPERFPAELSALQQWSADLPPGCRLLCECHADTALETPAMAARLATAAAPEKVGFILHPFFTPAPEQWNAALGARIVHWHVQVRDAADQHRFVQLAERADLVAARLTALKTHSLPATATIEFTRGVGEPAEDPSALLARAAADRATLLDQLSS